MRKVIIDTNGYIRLFLNDIPKQVEQVEKILKQAQKGQVEVLLPQIVIFEIHFSLEKFYHFRKEEIIDKLKLLVSSPNIKIESKEIFIEAITLYARNSSSVSFVDCFLLCKAKKEEAQLFTFERKLKKLL